MKSQYNWNNSATVFDIFKKLYYLKELTKNKIYHKDFLLFFEKQDVTINRSVLSSTVQVLENAKIVKTYFDGRYKIIEIIDATNFTWKELALAKCFSQLHYAKFRSKMEV